MTEKNVRDPLHGVTLEMMLTRLVEQYGWEKMGNMVDIRCFTNNPSIRSSLSFLRKTPWARAKVEEMYLSHTLGVFRRPSSLQDDNPQALPFGGFMDKRDHG